MIFKNIYVLAVTGASLITSTSIWLFRDSEGQTTLDSGVVKKPEVNAGAKGTPSKAKEEAPQTPSAKPSTPTVEPKPAPAAPKKEETQTGKGQAPKADGGAQSKPASQPSQPTKNQGDVTMVTVTVPSGGDAQNPDIDGILSGGTVITQGSKK